MSLDDPVCHVCGGVLGTSGGGLDSSPVRDAPFHEKLPAEFEHQFTIVEEMDARGLEAEVFIIRRNQDSARFFLKWYRRGFRPDADTLGKIKECDSSHVVKLEAFGRLKDGRWYELQEYCACGSLRGILNSCQGPLPDEQTRALLKELAEGLAHVHERGILHRDLKPENILVRRKQPLDLVIADFGSARLAHMETHHSMLPAAAHFFYLAPECMTADRDNVRSFRPASDWWALGMMLAESLLGRHPFDGRSNAAVCHQVNIGAVPLENIPEPWLHLCQGLLAHDPERRFGKMHIDRWWRNDSTLRGEVPTPVTARDSEIKPYPFGGANYSRPGDLADALTSNWNQARDEPLEYIEKWAFDQLDDIALTRTIRQLRERQPGDNKDLRLSLLLLVLTPTQSPCFLGFIVTPENLLKIAADSSQKKEPEATKFVATAFDCALLETLGASEHMPSEKDRRSLTEIGARWRASYDRCVATLRAASASYGRPLTATEDALAVLLAVAVSDQQRDKWIAPLAGKANNKDALDQQWYRRLYEGAANDVGALLALTQVASFAAEQTVRRRVRETAESRRLQALRFRGGAKAAIPAGLTVGIPLFICVVDPGPIDFGAFAILVGFLAAIVGLLNGGWEGLGVGAVIGGIVGWFGAKVIAWLSLSSLHFTAFSLGLQNLYIAAFIVTLLVAMVAAALGAGRGVEEKLKLTVFGVLLPAMILLGISTALMQKYSNVSLARAELESHEKFISRWGLGEYAEVKQKNNPTQKKQARTENQISESLPQQRKTQKDKNPAASFRKNRPKVEPQKDIDVSGDPFLAVLQKPINEPSKFSAMVNKYAPVKGYKAIALAVDNDGNWACGYTNYGRSSQEAANRHALSECKRYSVQGNVLSTCKLYAVGNEVVYNQNIKQKSVSVSEQRNESSAYGSTQVRMEPPVGNWTGTVNQPGHGSYSATMRLNGASSGSMDYSSLGCGGSFSFVGERNGRFYYIERITYGKDKCTDGGQIEVKPSGNHIYWEWTYGRQKSIGTFVRAQGLKDVQ